MNFEVYCDESCLEALSKKNAHKFIGIGGIWMPSEFRESFKQEIKKIKTRHNVYGELKWNKVSPKFLMLYKEIIAFFFSNNNIRFRIIIVESEKVDLIKFHNNDAELSFYKFYYQMIKTWIYDFNEYNVYLDLKKNRNKGRLKTLEKFLDNANYFSDVKMVQGLPSEQSMGIQLADILTGIVTAKFNHKTVSDAKKELIGFTEKYLSENQIKPTPKAEEKFNIFRINLEGGW